LSEFANHPKRARIALLVAAALHEVGDHDGSKEALRQAVEWGAQRRDLINVVIGQAHATLGRARLAAKDFGRAEKHFLNCITSIAPNRSAARFAKDRVFREAVALGFLPEARGLLEKDFSAIKSQSLLSSSVVSIFESKLDLLSSRTQPHGPDRRNFVVCGMLRSGSTLIYQLVCAILEQRSAVNRVGFLPEGQTWLPSSVEEVISVVKLHHFDEALAAMVASGRVAAIYTYRDPRDAVVSGMRQFSIPFDKALEWIEYISGVGAKWEATPNTMSLKYEDMIQDIPRLVTQLCAYMNVNISADTIEAIAADYTSDKQRARASQVPKGAYDPVNLLHFGHIGQADCSSATSSLNADEISRIEDRLSDWMRKHNYSPLNNS
jgi:tetratricopeptide (TPR) repeat protein